jgi:hypothetical protein
MEKKRRLAATTDKAKEKQILLADPRLEPSELEGEMENRRRR